MNRCWAGLTARFNSLVDGEITATMRSARGSLGWWLMDLPRVLPGRCIDPGENQSVAVGHGLTGSSQSAGPPQASP